MEKKNTGALYCDKMKKDPGVLYCAKMEKIPVIYFVQKWKNPGALIVQKWKKSRWAILCKSGENDTTRDLHKNAIPYIFAYDIKL